MLAHGSSFQILDTLLEVGEDGATREHIMRKSQISVRTFYKHLKELLATGIVQERGNRYYFPLTTLYAFRFKKWRDIDRLYDLDEVARNAVLNVVKDSTVALDDDLMCLWLVGSAARGEMRASSDLDFLAIVRSEEDYVAKVGNFDIQWVSMKRSSFLEKLRNGDEFAVSALREGLLLYEDGSAQRIYTTPIGKPSQSFFKEKENVVESFRDRFFEHLEFDEIVEANEVLSSLSSTVLRLILQSLGERTRGLFELLDLAEKYFPFEIHQDFTIACAEFAHLDRNALVELHRSISLYYDRFFARAEHLSSIGRSLLYGHPIEFERSLFQIFQELASSYAIEQNEDFDFLCLGERRLLFDGKTLTGMIGQEHIEPFFKNVQSQRRYRDAVGLLVVNSLREVPLLERSLEDENRLQRLAADPCFHVIPAIKLFQFYQGFYLSDLYGSYVLDQIILESLRYYLGGLLKSRLKRLEVRLREQEHDDDRIESSSIESSKITKLEIANDQYYENEDAIGFKLQYSFILRLDVCLNNYETWNPDIQEFEYQGPVDRVLLHERDGSATGILRKPGSPDATVVAFEPGLSEITYNRKELLDVLRDLL